MMMGYNALFSYSVMTILVVSLLTAGRKRGVACILGGGDGDT